MVLDEGKIWQREYESEGSESSHDQEGEIKDAQSTAPTTTQENPANNEDAASTISGFSEGSWKFWYNTKDGHSYNLHSLYTEGQVIPQGMVLDSGKIWQREYESEPSKSSHEQEEEFTQELPATSDAASTISGFSKGSWEFWYNPDDRHLYNLFGTYTDGREIPLGMKVNKGKIWHREYKSAAAESFAEQEPAIPTSSPPTPSTPPIEVPTETSHTRLAKYKNRRMHDLVEDHEIGAAGFYELLKKGYAVEDGGLYVRAYGDDELDDEDMEEGGGIKVEEVLEHEREDHRDRFEKLGIKAAYWNISSIWEWIPEVFSHGKNLAV